jgi:hypothetical protein
MRGQFLYETYISKCKIYQLLEGAIDLADKVSDEATRPSGGIVVVQGREMPTGATI